MKEDPGSVCKRLKNNTLIILMLLLSIILVGCSNEELENNLYNSKATLEDINKIETILASLEYPKDYKFSSIEIQNKNSKGLNINLKEEVPNLNRDFTNEAITVFTLVDDVDSVRFLSEKRKEILNSYKREDIDSLLEQKYKTTTKNIGSSKENFNKFLKIKKVD